MRALWVLAVLAACAATAQPPAEPDVAPDPLKALAAPLPVGATSPVPNATTLSEDSRLAQGGLAFGATVPGATVTLDGEAVPVDGEGRFLLGFGRDAGEEATLAIAYPDGAEETRTLAVEDRSFPESRVDGVPANTVNPYTEEDLAAIARGTALKDAAREASAEEPMWTVGFDWPARGRITSVFGAQRIYNGEPRRPHSGTDIARPLSVADPMDFVGTPVLAPSDGVVTLADPDMFFEGGLVLIDHGQGLESALMHMSALDVVPGDRVAKGQKVGEAGMTGRTTGPHVHWSLKLRDTLVDPELVVGEM